VSFHKRYISIETILDYLEKKQDLEKLFNSDCYIFRDEISSEVYKLHGEGFTDDEIKLKLNNYGTNC
jgi:hypothetical protein